MDSLSIKVEMFAGSDIENACFDLVRLSKKLGLCVITTANGVTLMAFPDYYGSSGDRLFASYRRCIKSGTPHAHASSRHAIIQQNEEQ